MKLTIGGQASKLIEKRSDERDIVRVVNKLRDEMNTLSRQAPPPITTADATPTVAWQDTMPANATADIVVEVVAQTSGGVDSASYWRRACFRRPGTAAAILVGVVDILGTDHETVAGWDCTLQVGPTSGDVSLLVTGAGATTVTWRAYVKALVTPWE